MKKSLLSLLSVVLLLTVVIAGCVKEQKAVNVKAGDRKAIILNYWTSTDLHKQFMDDAVVTWNKNHPDKTIILKTDVYPNDEHHNRLLIALQSGTGAPDIADIEINKFAKFLKGTKPGLVELNDVIDPVKDKLIMGRLKNYAKDSKYYGIDFHIGAEVMYYNKEIMATAGVNINDIITWEDYIAAGKKVLEKTGKPMCTLEMTDILSYYPLIKMQGSDLLDKNGNPMLDNAINIKTLQMLKDMMYKDKIAIAAPGGFHHAEEYWAWMDKGNAASIWMPLWYMGRFVQCMPDLKNKMVIRPMPVFPGGKKSAGMGGTGTAITTQSKNIEIAKQFLAECKLSKEGSIKTWTILGFDPIRIDAWSDPAMSVPNKYTDYFDTDIFNVVKSVVDDIGPINIGAKYPDAVSMMQKNVIFKVLKEQSQTPEEALKAANEELKAK